MANDMLTDLLRRRSRGQSRVKTLTEKRRGLQTDSSFNPTVGGGNVQGMQGMVSPTAAAVNWGGVLEKGAGAYKSSSLDKQLEKAEQEAEDTEFELANEIYQSTLKDDPEGAKLIRMAQMGVPGAEQALANHIAPKTQSMAVLMQAVTSGSLDPSMAREVAGQFGVSPDTAERAAKYAMESKQRLEEQKFQQKAALRAMTSGGSGGSRSGKLSFQEYQALDPQSKAEYDRFAGVGGRNAKQDGMTPGERNVRAKNLIELDNTIMEGEQQIVKGEELKSVMDDPDTFGPKQKLSQTMSEFQNPIIGNIGISMRSKGVAMLEDFVLSEVLDRMAKLGGSDSNEELRKMRASLPSAMNNQEAAKALFDSVQLWQKKTQEKIKARRQKLQSGEFFDVTNDPAKPTGQIEILEILD